jgi:hypothetical protein
MIVDHHFTRQYNPEDNSELKTGFNPWKPSDNYIYHLL